MMLLIARHAESSFNDENRIQGHLDSALTKKGMRQAKRLADRLGRLKTIQKIYTSDLGRAFRTTQIVAQKLKVPVVLHRGLREICLGRWEGLTPEEVNERFKNGYELWRKCPSRMRIPGGETILKFHARIRKTLDEIAAEKAERILVMTHGGVISSLLAHWMKADFDRVLLNLRIDNTGVNIVEFRKKRVLIHAVNDITHLRKEKSDGITIFTQA